MLKMTTLVRAVKIFPFILQAEHESAFVRRRITTVLEESVSTGHQMDVTPGCNTHLPMFSGTVPSQNTPTQVMPVMTCEQPSHQAAIGAFAAQPFNSASRTSSGDEPSVCAEPVPSMESVSVRKKGRYEAHDKVDQYLLLQVSRHVQADMVELLAEHLGVSEEQYVDTRTSRTQPANPRAQGLKVCNEIQQAYWLLHKI